MAKQHQDEGVGTPTAPDGVGPVPFGTAYPAAAGGPLPRVVKELERRVPGTVRYKVRADNYPGMNKPRYVLAKQGDEDGAKKLYAKASGIAEYAEKLKKAGVAAEEPVIYAFELAD